MSVWKIVAIAFCSAVVGGLVVALFKGNRAQWVVQSLKHLFSFNPNIPSSMIIGLGKALDNGGQI